MQITAENKGQIFCLENASKLIRIKDVNDTSIIYDTELGHRQTAQGAGISGFPVQDPTLIETFESNFVLGQTLNAAEQSALRKILIYAEDTEIWNEAAKVLGSVRTMQKGLEQTINDRDKVLGQLQDIVPAGTVHGDLEKTIQAAAERTSSGHMSMGVSEYAR